ncbi:PREDICTED: LEAF RUST 10 DISEASE-RESISTANCE LOCUS RECEPTOR-LIKE PROTEIN KINASE-like 1.1 [Theobroma cacao]|uniref:non-specific serine/threonine protein kinase n=1 Tax=Theobroma cacao TaxID=3641 RepID=A0AB32VZW3_THECC|nr:PREDICTED: LEAF RUST 10 DISEASE-RESISTANCE LOCUS RECEPTOR-LIKE PROTEIN KINASE-like 1.1 [Theobroma cacao]
MNQILLLNLSSTLFPVIHFFIFSSFFLAKKALAVDKNFTICSEPSTCGRHNIKFPFFIQERRCGYPGFNISCRNSTDPILSLPDGDYIIHDIFYQNQSFRVSKAVAFDGDAVCSHSIANLSIPEDRLSLPPNQTEILLLFNCNLTMPWTRELSQYKVYCSAENETNATLALFNNDPKLNSASKSCKKTVVAPVAFYEGERGVENMLNRGFVLKWIASNCSICEASGGKCGFDYSTYHFKCFCPDRPHAWHCRPENKNLGLKLGLGIGCPVTLIILLLSIYVFRYRYKHKYASSNFLRRNGLSSPSSKSDLERSNTIGFGLLIFTYSELVEATNNFDDEKELGDGGFGTVYYGKLRDGREVAIKRLYQHNCRRLEQFINEVEILTRLRHKNLVSLYGCTSRRSRDLLLVYEFIPNGTVADHLHGDRAQSGLLTWPIRMSIAIETASALAYLHTSDIVHRDVKTNNILLDDNFSVKVADFGLSRLFPHDVTHISTAPQGTPGYVDPEYHQCYQLTGKSDVYSFGVVLIELISSMPAVDITRHRQEINLANLAINKIQKCAFDELIDPNLGYKSDEEVTRMTTSVAELAFRCLQQEKEMRPSMEEVLEELQRIQSEDYRLENVQEEEHTDTEVPGGVQPPPSPPNGDHIALLKNIRPPPSPISVTDKWASRSTTPDASG